MNKVEDVRSVVKGHLGKAKTRLRVNQESLESAIGLLQGGSEPDANTSAHISKSFWHLRELKKNLLSREMDIRDQKSHFEINFPTKLEEFFGHVAVLGPSGSGKGWWITALILRMWKACSLLNRRRVIYVSAEASLDKTLDRLRIKRFEDWFVPIDCSYEAGEESGMDPDTFWAEKVDSVVSNCRNCIVVLDDTQDGYSPRAALRTQDKLVRVGRHKNISVISVFHSIKNGQFTRQLTQSAGHLVLFGKAQRGRVRDFFNEVLGMPRREAQDLVDFMNMCGRASVVRTLAPVTLICEKYLRLL